MSRIPTTTHDAKYTVISFLSVCLCYDYLDLTRGHRWFCARATRGRNIGTKYRYLSIAHCHRREPSVMHTIGGVTNRTRPNTTADHCLCHLVHLVYFFCFFSELSSESFSLSTHDIITLVLPSSPSGHAPPGAPPPPIVCSSFGSYKSWVCTDNRPIRDSVDYRHQRQRSTVFLR